MKPLIKWHVAISEVALKLFLLNLCWIIHMLIGGIVLGIFPATAAVFQLIRKDLKGIDIDKKLFLSFFEIYKKEFFSANILGYAFLAAWVVIYIDGRILKQMNLGMFQPAISIIVFLFSVFLFLMTTNVFMIFSQFEGNILSYIKRSAVLVLAKPVQSIVTSLIVAIVLCIYYVVPGLIPVFGLSIIIYFSYSYMWSKKIINI